jgi:hypothetical protein
MCKEIKKWYHTNSNCPLCRSKPKAKIEDELGIQVIQQLEPTVAMDMDRT